MKHQIIGWAILLSGTAIWIYGYCTAGTPSLIDWHANMPWWVSTFLPNFESEVGAALTVIGMVPIYWPART